MKEVEFEVDEGREKEAIQVLETHNKILMCAVVARSGDTVVLQIKKWDVPNVDGRTQWPIAGIDTCITGDGSRKGAMLCRRFPDEEAAHEAFEATYESVCNMVFHLEDLHPNMPDEDQSDPDVAEDGTTRFLRSCVLMALAANGWEIRVSDADLLQSEAPEPASIKMYWDEERRERVITVDSVEGE